MVNSLILLCALQSPPSIGLKYTLGGLNLHSDPGNECFYQARSKTYLINTNDCDGSHRSITLTKDRRVVELRHFDVPDFGKDLGTDYNLVEKNFPLETGKAISLGSPLSSTKAKLGRPFKTVKRGSRNEFICLLYREKVMYSKTTGEIVHESYIFKSGRLVEIRFDYDRIPGCGDVPTDHSGWPWSLF